MPQKQAMIKRTLGATHSVIEGFLGTIHANLAMFLQSSRQTADVPSYNEHEQHEYKTTYTISPASWLVRLGIHYGLYLSFRSSTRG